MDFVNIIAIVRSEVLEKVETRLREVAAPGVTVSPIRGYGEYADLYKEDWMVDQMRVEVFAEAERAEELAAAIMDAAHTGVEGDGIVAVVPVQQLYHIRTRRQCTGRPC